MLCQKCNKEPATVVFTQILDQEKSVQHLCGPCAEEMGEAHGVVVSVKTGGGREEPTADADPGPTCEVCGTTFAEFSKAGLFGCPGCYEGFSSRLPRVLRKIHGVPTHDAQVPPADPAPGALLEALEAQLAKAVSREAFEEAGQLRDRIALLRDAQHKAP